jgi:hypothetical protein
MNQMTPHPARYARHPLPWERAKNVETPMAGLKPRPSSAFFSSPLET